MATILLADDHADLRDMMTRQLQKHGYTVETATNGLEAVASVSRSVPSLILMDVNMPELDGFEATLQIRATHADSHIPVIALTAYALPSDEARARAVGCDAFHSKPVDFDKLFCQIRELVGDATAEQADSGPTAEQAQL